MSLGRREPAPLEAVMLSKMPTQAADWNLGRIGRCIYCGSTEGLTDEHVIPKGLGGPAQLYDASCKSCNDETSAFELRVLRDQLGAFRAKMGLPTRRPKKRRTTFPVRVRHGVDWQEVEVPLSQYAAVGAFPRFPPPGFTVGREPGEPIPITYTAVALAPRDGLGMDLARRAGVDAVEQTITTYPVDFMRMLAKIAWGFSVSLFGLGRLDPYRLGVIHATDPDPSTWVGMMEKGDTGFDIAPASGLQVRVAEVNEHAIAWIRLFADRGAPEYVVVVGRLKPAA